MATNLEPHRLLVRALADAPLMAGRRPTVKYHDLGAGEATGGAITASYITTDGPMGVTGWHYHGVETQILLVLEGWFDIAFEDGTIRRIGDGAFGMIPGGTVHNEIGKSERTVAIEILVGEMSTVPCEKPAGFDLPIPE